MLKSTSAANASRSKAMKTPLPRSMMSLVLATTMAPLCTSGCKVGPDYHAPATTIPARWSVSPSTQPNAVAQEATQVEQWWTTFNDPTLDDLIRRAAESNLDVEIATERIREARGSLGIATSALFPNADATGSYSHSGSGRSKSQELWRAGLDATWELDIFGGNRRAVEAANASLEATIEDRRDVLVTLLGEVATDYILLRGQQQQIVIANENLEVQIRNAHARQEAAGHRHGIGRRAIRFTGRQHARRDR
jgi:outer membrane protein TolC